MSKTPLVELQAGSDVAHLRLNRPEKLNALDMSMIAELADRCREIEHDDEIHVVILSGNGKAFCAGGDIGAWSRMEPEAFGRHWVREGHMAFDAVARLRQPVIAVLDGDALGGGLELAACADYRIAEQHIRVGQPEAGLGVVPGWSGTQRTVRRFGAQIVRRMAVFGEILSAEQALSNGLVDRVVGADIGIAAAEELASAVCDRSPRATELTKMMINAAEGEEGERIIDAIAGALAAGSEDLAAGVEAFRAKKPHSFRRDKS